ncbi:MAG: hypothetical protein RDU01_01855 [Thermodesulfovibrionales bacterium]|nr:hypothetical protein [Thermodesulfovibrionales bacterium]
MREKTCRFYDTIEKRGVENKKMKDWDWIIGLLVLVVWLILQFFVFPKIGIPT